MEAAMDEKIGGDQPEEAERIWTAHHEAAHAVATLRLRGEDHLEDATIVPAGTLLGVVRTEDPRDYALMLDESTGYSIPNEKEIDAAIVGKLAGCFGGIRAGEPSEQATMGSGTDLDAAEELLAYTTTELHTLRSRAQQFVENQWGAIEVVATELLEHETLDPTEISFAVDIADGKERARENLARYRVNRDCALR
jgi:ATP-dependent Zn protease